MEKVKEIVERFLDCWQKQGWHKMMDCTQLTWKELQKTPAERLKVMFGLMKLKSYEIGKAKQVTDVCWDVKAKVRYRTIRRRYVSSDIVLRVICEKGYMKPDVEGTWGVNPLSLFREQNG